MTVEAGRTPVIKQERANGMWADVCQTCGLAVWNVDQHLRWHASLPTVHATSPTARSGDSEASS